MHGNNYKRRCASFMNMPAELQADSLLRGEMPFPVNITTSVLLVAVLAGHLHVVYSANN